MSVPKCSECEHRKSKPLITNYKIRHSCNATMTGYNTIGYGDKLPKTSPRWCPLRKAGDSNA